LGNGFAQLVTFAGNDLSFPAKTSSGGLVSSLAGLKLVCIVLSFPEDNNQGSYMLSQSHGKFSFRLSFRSGVSHRDISNSVFNPVLQGHEFQERELLKIPVMGLLKHQNVNVCVFRETPDTRLDILLGKPKISYRQDKNVTGDNLFAVRA